MTDADRRRLALGDQLRELRQTSGLSGKQLAHQAGWPASKVSRIENARQAVSDADIRTWCAITGAAVATGDLLREQLRSVRLEEARHRTGARRARRAAAEPTTSQDIEQAASVIRIFELALVPTLVQTAEYARHVLAATSVRADAAEVGVQAWMERQRVLYAPGRRIEITLTESALRYPVCPPEVLCAQIDRLLALQGLPGVWLGVIPLDTRMPVLATHGFWILDDVVVIRTLTSEVLVRERPELVRYQRLVDELRSVAVQGDGARSLLGRLVAELAAAT